MLAAGGMKRTGYAWLLNVREEGLTRSLIRWPKYCVSRLSSVEQLLKPLLM
jgi:hypothetical protein